MKRILERLILLTKEGKISWEYRDDYMPSGKNPKSVFVSSFKGYGRAVLGMTKFGDLRSYYFGIYDGSHSLVKEVYISSTPKENDELIREVSLLYSEVLNRSEDSTSKVKKFENMLDSMIFI